MVRRSIPPSERLLGDLAQDRCLARLGPGALRDALNQRLPTGVIGGALIWLGLAGHRARRGSGRYGTDKPGYAEMLFTCTLRTYLPRFGLVGWEPGMDAATVKPCIVAAVEPRSHPRDAAAHCAEPRGRTGDREDVAGGGGRGARGPGRGLSDRPRADRLPLRGVEPILSRFGRRSEAPTPSLPPSEAVDGAVD